MERVNFGEALKKLLKKAYEKRNSGFHNPSFPQIADSITQHLKENKDDNRYINIYKVYFAKKREKYTGLTWGTIESKFFRKSLDSKYNPKPELVDLLYLYIFDDKYINCLKLKDKSQSVLISYLSLSSNPEEIEKVWLEVFPMTEVIFDSLCSSSKQIELQIILENASKIRTTLPNEIGGGLIVSHTQVDATTNTNWDADYNMDTNSNDENEIVAKYSINTIRTENDTILLSYLNTLKALYNKFKLTRGCEVSKNAIIEYPFDIDVIKYWALFRNRKMLWSEVRKELSKKAIESNDNAVKAECYLAIFEGYMNEWTKFRYDREYFANLLRAKDEYLEFVPDKEINGRYHYLLARYYEAEWWTLPETAKSTSLAPRIGIESINKSINLYGPGQSGYQAITEIPWWLYGHKTIMLKIWGHNGFEKALNDYEDKILNIVFLPENIQKKSMHIYAITYFILKNDPDKLKKFLIELDGYLANINDKTEIFNQENSGKDIDTVDISSENENFTFFHIDLIFYYEKDKRESYNEIIMKWIQDKIQ
jgi:hypothetical protein